MSDATQAMLRELIARVAENAAGLDTETSRALLDEGELALCMDDLAHELGKRPPLDHDAVRALHELAVAVGASPEAVASLAALPARTSVLGLATQWCETPIGLAEFRDVTIDGSAFATLAFLVVSRPEDALSTLDALANGGPVELVQCTYCGDPACGSVRLLVELDGDRVRWHDLGPVEAAGPRPPRLGPFTFDRDAYASFVGALRTLAR